MICISRGHSPILLGSCCCDCIYCWVILTERLWRWGWRTADYEYILMMFLIKWPHSPCWIMAGQKGGDPSLFQSLIHEVYDSCYFGLSIIPYPVDGLYRLHIQRKFLSGTTCIPWLWLIFHCSVGEREELSGIFWDVTSLQKHWRVSLGLPNNVEFDGMSLLYNVVYYFPPELWIFHPLWEQG